MQAAGTESEAAIARLFPRLHERPDLYLYAFEPITGTADLIVMDEADYARASFLNPGILTAQTLGARVPLFRVIEAAEAAPRTRPVHFIFHQGHTGSTLLSRLLDATGSTLGLREPWPLLTLAEHHDVLDTPEAVLSPDAYARLRDALLALWSRSFRPGQTAVVKASSHGERIGADLLAAAPDARAVTLHLPPEPYLATTLARANVHADLLGFARERMRRLVAMFGEVSEPLHALSTGELAAMAWLVERASQRAMLDGEALAARVLDLDFETLLAGPEETLARVAAHFELGADAAAVRRAVTGPVMSRYSKAPGQSYSARVRAERLDAARAAHGTEIARGLSWLERMGEKAPLAGRIASAFF
ncbi:hypothetical protein E5163_11335 [Marinicauda algicola]|uniref:Sulfotransferase family protein n=1 Tax=Marinicauda algicola TaxID=2029849 RepID=A0A4S2GZ89_9PROT|nr:sulfotransferase [Marinicauda algicola]TGY88403.1 hypothetical protein E5163_11335 [Marinicauda algicola]